MHRYLALATVLLALGCKKDGGGIIKLPEGTPPPAEQPRDQPPVALNAQTPVEYPPALFDQGIEGTVILRLYADSTGALIKDSTRVFLRDVYDHTVHIIDNLETFRDLVSGILDIYLSSVNNRLNEVMRVLTVIATIFMPLTFLAGIYGMNFEYMPELKWRFGYGLIWFVFLTTAAVMIIYFRRKKWM